MFVFPCFSMDTIHQKCGGKSVANTFSPSIALSCRYNFPELTSQIWLSDWFAIFQAFETIYASCAQSWCNPADVTRVRQVIETSGVTQARGARSGKRFPLAKSTQWSNPLKNNRITMLINIICNASNRRRNSKISSTSGPSTGVKYWAKSEERKWTFDLRTTIELYTLFTWVIFDFWYPFLRSQIRCGDSDSEVTGKLRSKNETWEIQKARQSASVAGFLLVLVLRGTSVFDLYLLFLF